jgi:hypothetical protein
MEIGMKKIGVGVYMRWKRPPGRDKEIPCSMLPGCPREMT